MVVSGILFDVMQPEIAIIAIFRWFLLRILTTFLVTLKVGKTNKCPFVLTQEKR